jgi:hypothetical protein
VGRLALGVQIFENLIRAWMVKATKKMARVHLPPVQADRQLSKRNLLFVINCADIAVRFGTPRTGRKCFFRAFIMGSVLRKQGMPVTMNVGLCGFGDFPGEQCVDGHCWLTHDDHPFAESRDPREDYPDFVGIAPNGVRYWLGLGRSSKVDMPSRLGGNGIYQ